MIVADRTTHRLTVGTFACYFIENPKTLFPAGTYGVVLTPSPRAKAGGLWTPWPDHKLPLILVPGREGIRIHAANRPDQLEGCIAVGYDWLDGEVGHSRAALTDLTVFLTFPTTLEVLP